MSNEFFQGWHSQPLQQAKQQMPAGETEGAGTEGEGSQGSTFEYSDFAQGILKDVPDEHKEILQPYLTKWDSGVQRRFQDLHSQYKPYADLGWDTETTQQMAEVYRVLNEEPERLYEALKEQFDTEAQNGSVGEGQTDPVIQGQLPPEIMEQLTQHNQVLEALAQYVLGEQSSKNEAIEDKDFESYMGLLTKEYGNFDEQYVTMCIANGMDGEAAVKQYQSMTQEILNKAAAATNGLPPATLSSAGGGAVAQAEPQKLGSYDSKDIKQLITNVITQANQAGQ